MNLKSNYFKSNELTSKLKESTQNLENIDDELYSSLLNWFKEQEDSPRITNRLTKVFANSTGRSAEKINDSFSAIYKFINVFAYNKDDAPNEILNDIIEQEPDLITNQELFLERLKDAHELSRKYDLFNKRSYTRNVASPTLVGSEFSVIFKPVIEDKFYYDEMDIQDYEPNILEYMPGVLIQLTDSDKRQFSFQMDPDNFERFLSDLIALQVELKASKKT